MFHFLPDFTRCLSGVNQHCSAEASRPTAAQDTAVLSPAKAVSVTNPL